MRVRPFFWLLLLLACVSVLSIAALRPSSIPAILRVQVNTESLVMDRTALIQVHLTDTQGQPINKAQVKPSARMPAMEMEPTRTNVTSLGDGQYAIHLHLNMAGMWEITIHTQADGFTALTYVLNVQVASGSQAGVQSITLHTPSQASSWFQMPNYATLQPINSPPIVYSAGIRTSGNCA